LGIVNLEAMACGTAVVASDVGGIPEVVVDGVTGTLVHYDAGDPAGYRAGLAKAVNELIADPAKAERYGLAGRQRCIEEFSWAHVAEQTLEIYRKVSA
jgi:starch synthase